MNCPDCKAELTPFNSAKDTGECGPVTYRYYVCKSAEHPKFERHISGKERIIASYKVPLDKPNPSHHIPD